LPTAFFPQQRMHHLARKVLRPAGRNAVVLLHGAVQAFPKFVEPFPHGCLLRCRNLFAASQQQAH
jgi:hypothetical protein